jgi:hypothetical protein
MTRRKERTVAKAEKITFPKKMDDEARRKRLGLPPDIDKHDLALTVMFDKRPKLEPRERLFIAGLLLDPKYIDAIARSGRNPELVPLKRGRGRPTLTAAAVRADKIAETYFIERARLSHAKHKEEIVPNVARYFRVSPIYVDKILKRLDPTRRAEMKAHAAKWGEAYAKWLATPKGIRYARQKEIQQRAPFHRIDIIKQPEKYREAYLKWLTTPDGIESKRLDVEMDTDPPSDVLK